MSHLPPFIRTRRLVALAAAVFLLLAGVLTVVQQRQAKDLSADQPVGRCLLSLPGENFILEEYQLWEENNESNPEAESDNFSTQLQAYVLNEAGQAKEPPAAKELVIRAGEEVAVRYLAAGAAKEAFSLQIKPDEGPLRCLSVPGSGNGILPFLSLDGNLITKTTSIEAHYGSKVLDRLVVKLKEGPKVSLRVQPERVTRAQEVTLSWSVNTSVDRLELTDNKTGLQKTITPPPGTRAGSEKVTVEQTTTFTITAFKGDEQGTSQVTVRRTERSERIRIKSFRLTATDGRNLTFSFEVEGEPDGQVLQINDANDSQIAPLISVVGTTSATVTIPADRPAGRYIIRLRAWEGPDYFTSRNRDSTKRELPVR